MAGKSVRKKTGKPVFHPDPPVQASATQPAQLLSFLKEAGALPWTERDFAKSLHIDLKETKNSLAVLHLEGYIEPVGRSGTWRTTEAGTFVSGAKAPRFTPQSVESALSDLADRIKAANSDPDAPYIVTQAVAFGISYVVVLGHKLLISVSSSRHELVGTYTGQVIAPESLLFSNSFVENLLCFTLSPTRVG